MGTVEDDGLRRPLTRTGAVMGTPAYMAPEQLRGREADARSDQFGYSVALYEAVYGVRPFKGRTLAALMVSVLAGDVPPPPKGKEVPTALRAALVRGLAKEPLGRWPTIDANANMEDERSAGDGSGRREAIAQLLLEPEPVA